MIDFWLVLRNLHRRDKFRCLAGIACTVASATDTATNHPWRNSFTVCVLNEELTMPLKSNGWTDAPADVIDHIDVLFSYALVLARSNDEAVALVQETYDRYFEATKRLGISHSTKSWMFTALRSIWLRRMRRKRTRPETLSIEEVNSNLSETSKSLPAHGISRIECLEVREAIQQLPLDFREVILLREYAELSFQEIAKVLNCPVDTVMSLLTGARSKLRMLLSAILLMQGGSTAQGRICKTTTPI
jgi:RNA polymerase sigma-70 factor (ECF subfamily)